MRIGAIDNNLKFGAKNFRYIPLDELVASTSKKELVNTNSKNPDKLNEIMKQIPLRIKLKRMPVGQKSDKTKMKKETK